MTERSTDRTAMLRRSGEELLAERGMAAEPVALAPQPHPETAPETRGGPHYADAVFSHGGRRTPGTAGPTAGPATHTDLPGHRHRGAERHSAH